MAYDFTAASSQYLSTASAPASGTPMTIACWARPSESNAGIVSVGVNGGTHRNQLTAAGSDSGTYRIAASSVGSVTANNADGTNRDYKNQTWHLAGVFSSSSGRSIYVAGLSEGTSTTDVGSQNSFTSLTIGSRWATTIGAYYSGWIAEIGIWNVALTAAEIASLSKGMTCDKVRPQSLVFYAPLVRNLQDVKGGLTITNNNTATVAAHPRVYA